jgi:hypothetical protein
VQPDHATPAVPTGTQSHVRPRLGPVPGYVEYDNGKGGRARKPFPNIAGNAARRFYILQCHARRNPSLVKAAR